MREYKIAKGWAIFIYIFAPLIIGVFGYLLFMPFIPGMKGDAQWGTYWFLAPVSLGMIILMIIGLLDTIKGRIIITGDSIRSISTFVNRELKFDEIKGFIVRDKYILVEPNDESKKGIKISTYIGKVDVLKMWLSSHFLDLDIVNIINENDEILKSEEYGRTSEEREEKLKQAQQISKILNWIGGIVAAWTIFLADPYEYSIIASISIPIIAIITLKFSRGLIRLDERKDSAHPTLFLAVFGPSLGLCLRALLDFNIFDYSNIWMFSILIFVVLMIFIQIGNKEFDFKSSKSRITIFALSLFLFGYSYGFVVTLNCYYDKSTPEIFKSKIVDKRVSSSKTTTYYFYLEPWGTQTEANEVSVSKDLYMQLEKNDEVTIYFKKGHFDIPWFIVTE